MTKAHTAPSLPVFSPRSLVLLLWDRAQSSLTPRERDWLTRETPEFVAMHAMQLQTVMEGVGCLVACEGEGNKSGGFQGSDDLPDLLFTHANQMSFLSALTRITAELVNCSSTEDVSSP